MIQITPRSLPAVLCCVVLGTAVAVLPAHTFLQTFSVHHQKTNYALNVKQRTTKKVMKTIYQLGG